MAPKVSPYTVLPTALAGAIAVLPAFLAIPKLVSASFLTLEINPVILLFSLLAVSS